jgi:hypothetical protein
MSGQAATLREPPTLKQRRTELAARVSAGRASPGDLTMASRLLWMLIRTKPAGAVIKPDDDE